MLVNVFTLSMASLQMPGGVYHLPSPKLSSSLPCVPRKSSWLEASLIKSSSESILPAVVVAGVAIFDTLFRRDTGKLSTVSGPFVPSRGFLWIGPVSFFVVEVEVEVVNGDDLVRDGVVPSRDEVAATPLIPSSPSTIAASTAFRFLVKGGVVKAGKETWRGQYEERRLSEERKEELNADSSEGDQS